jgi:hypothetical protein
MNPAKPTLIKGLRGQVTEGDFGKGSKSERVAIYLETGSPGQRYVLRRKTGPVFGDSELAGFVGKRVECDGFVTGSTLLAERIEPVT